MALWRGGVLLAVVLATGCTSYSPVLRRQSAERAAEAAGWVGVRLPTDSFVLAGFIPRTHPASETLTIYIEGDGLAWIGHSQISLDPTPLRATGLELALRHPQGVAAYLARPCQYVDGSDRRNCAAIWWTDRRFAPEVVGASNQAIEQLKQRFNAKHLVLIGYSGGGAIAALVAARRSDVVRLVTVAGNLDHAAWTRRHHLSPLLGSLNPADAWQDLLDIPQLHFIGGKDAVMEREIAESYQARFPMDRQPPLRIIDDFDHVCCWVAAWPTLYH